MKKIYKYSPFAIYFFYIISLILLFLSLGNAIWGSVAHFYLGAIVSIAGLLFGYVISKRKFIIFEDKIVSYGKMSKKEVIFSEIRGIRLDNPTEAIQVYCDNKNWPNISVYYGVKEWRDLARELVDRAPPDVEVNDAWGVLDAEER